MAKKQTKKSAPARPQLGDNVEIPGAGVVVRTPITETLEMTVAVEAESREEAQQIASDNWKNGDYILYADHFKDVTFRTKDRSRDRGER